MSDTLGLAGLAAAAELLLVDKVYVVRPANDRAKVLDQTSGKLTVPAATAVAGSASKPVVALVTGATGNETTEAGRRIRVYPYRVRLKIDSPAVYEYDEVVVVSCQANPALNGARLRVETVEKATRSSRVLGCEEIR